MIERLHPFGSPETAPSLVSQAIDAGIIYGASPSNPHEYRSPTDVLAARARLGISRGFLDHQGLDMWSAMAACRQVASEANALKEIQPVFPIAPSQFFQKGIEDELAALAADNPHAIFRLCADERDGDFRTVVQFLSQLEDGRTPVLFLPEKCWPSLHLLIDAASAHPRIQFVLSEHFWDGHRFVHAAMKEADNIFTDTSLLHVHEDIAHFADRYSAARIVFNLGYRTLGGAALGGVLSANLGLPDKEQILFRNIERLTQWTPGVEAPVPRLPEGEWSHYLREGRASVPVIDCHGHLGASSGWPVRHSYDEEEQAVDKLHEMTSRGVELFVVSGLRALMSHPLDGNRFLESALLKLGDPRLLAWFVYNPHFAAELDAFLQKVPQSRIFIGFKLWCDYWKVPLTDDRLRPMWEAAHAFALPVKIHTWEGEFNSPGMLDGIAARYPQARLIMAHCGGTDAGRAEAEAMAQKHPNAYLEWCGSFLSRKPWEETLCEVGAGKLLFGTDAVLHEYDWELARLLSQPLAPEDLHKILRENFRQILNLSVSHRTHDSIF